MNHPDLDQQADFGDGTLGWTATAYDTNAFDPRTGTHKVLRQVFCRAADEPTAYEVGRQKLALRLAHHKGWWTVTVKPASYAELELQPIQGAK